MSNLTQTSDLVYDGQTDFSGGQDASKTPDKTAQNAVYASINCTFQNGVVGPRDGFAVRSDRLTFPEVGISIGGKVATPYKQLFEQGKFQALIPYCIGSKYYLLIIISGVVYAVDQQTWAVVILDFPSGPRLNEFASRLNWSSAGKYVVIFDYPSPPAIIQNLTIRRSEINAPDYEVPISTIGAYNSNRLFIGNAGNEFTGGDPTGSTAAPEAPISFIEVEQPAATFFGEIFQLPTAWQNNPITYMGFLPLIDTSTGIGPLLVATNSQIYAFNTQNPRSTWEQGNFGQAIVGNAGIAGARSAFSMNSDVFFFSQDGQIRSLSMSRDEQRKWSKDPISREIKNWLRYQDPSLVQFATGTFFDNKLIFTVNPYRTTAFTLDNQPTLDYAFGGFGVLEIDNIATLSNQGQPVWAGLWTGINPMDLTVNNGRCFVAAKALGNVNTLWEITRDQTYDIGPQNQIRDIRSRVYTRNYLFNDPFNYKSLALLDAPFEEVSGEFSFKVAYRPAQTQNFLPWTQFKQTIPSGFCDVPTQCFNGFDPYSYPELRAGQIPAAPCDPVSKTVLDRFRKVQLRFDISGRSWQLPWFKLAAIQYPQNLTDTTCTLDAKAPAVCSDCNDDWLISDFGGC